MSATSSRDMEATPSNRLPTGTDMYWRSTSLFFSPATIRAMIEDNFRAGGVEVGIFVAPERLQKEKLVRLPLARRGSVASSTTES